MVAFPPSVHALKRVVAGFGPELAPILSLEMAAGHVKARRRNHATRKPVKVRRRTFRNQALFFVTVPVPFLCLKLCLKVLLVAYLVKIFTTTLVVCLLCSLVWLWILIQL